MGSLKFELIVFGGRADGPDAKVSAAKLAEVLSGIDRDVQDIGRNLAGTGAFGESADSRVFVDGPPTKGQSVAMPLSGNEELVRALVHGAQILRDSPDTSDEKLPNGWSPPIVRRASDYSGKILEDHGGFRLALPAVNGTPETSAVFDARFKAAADLKIAAIDRAEQLRRSERRSAAVDRKIYGYSIQGVLFELSDPNYEDPDGKLTVEIDTRDGHVWVCHLDKAIAPVNLQDLWRTEVLVYGDATFKPKKNLIDAKQFRSLRPMSDPVGAMERLVTLCADMGRDEPVQNFMDRVRERN